MVISYFAKVSRPLFPLISQSVSNSALKSTNKSFCVKLIQFRQYSVQNLQSAMRFIQFQRKGEQSTRLGALSEDGQTFVDLSAQGSVPNDMIDFIKSNVSLADVDAKIKAGKWETLDENVLLLAPVSKPEKIVCIGLNYLGHCQEQNKEAPKEPMFFSKYASTLTGPTGDVILHKISTVGLEQRLGLSRKMSVRIRN